MGAIQQALFASLSSATYDADAQAFFDAIVANGGTISTATKGYVNTFVLASKANSYWTKLARINLFCGNQLPIVPLKAGGANALDALNNFVGSDYSEATGLTGNGSTKYLNTGYVPSSQATVNDTHISIYNRSSSSGGTNGNGFRNGDAWEMYAPFSDGRVYDDQYSSAGGRVQTSPNSTPYGFLIGTRTASNAHVIYRNGSSAASNSTSSGTFSNVNGAIYIFACNVNGTAGDYGSNNFASYSIGSGLTSGNVTDYNTDMQAFQTSLSRNV